MRETGFCFNFLLKYIWNVFGNGNRLYVKPYEHSITVLTTVDWVKLAKLISFTKVAFLEPCKMTWKSWLVTRIIKAAFSNNGFRNQVSNILPIFRKGFDARFCFSILSVKRNVALFALSIKQRNLVSNPVQYIGNKLSTWLRKPLFAKAA